ncbi:hypothetical protein OEZ86_013312 [Tetradesmus obliquus]|nr:hypothetical protein OEZ86_013312 [Tetradesmus obliquus]
MPAAKAPLVAVILATCLVAQIAAQRPFVVGHRGSSGKLPEHTKEAYLLAIQEGADFIECDVVVTKDLQLICRHEPLLDETTDAADKFKDRSTTYEIDGYNMTGVFASDLTLAEVRTLRATQRVSFRNQSYNSKFNIPTFAEYLDIALQANRPVGVYPETKHPTWHNSLPALKAAGTTFEKLVVEVLKAKGYTASAPFNSTAWRARPIFLQSFEVNSLRRLSELTPVPTVYLLDDAPDPETHQPLFEIVSDSNLASIKSFVSTVAPWKSLLYRVPVGGKKLVSTGLTAHLKRKGFMVHTYTIRNEVQYVLPTCGGVIACEFRFLFKSEGIDGAFADYPGTLMQWVKKNYKYTPI